MKRRYKISIFISILIAIWLVWPICASLEDRPVSTILFDRDDHLLGARIASDEQWRFPYIDSVPDKFATAILTYEDKDFYSHIGVDFSSILRAVRQNLKENKIVSGASTITMQVMRLHYPSAKRSYAQKIKEVLFAIRKDLLESKEDILKTYCTHAPFGGNIIGLETASWRYFDKSPDRLTWAESATLAVLPNAPGLIHPGRNRGQLLQKRNQLLHRLLITDALDSIEYQLSIIEPLLPQPGRLPNEAPHLLEQMKKSGTNRYHCTVSQSLQKSIADIVINHQQINSQKNIQNAAVLVVDNRTGEILSYHGNTAGTSHENYNDMVRRPRSTGSILKPLLYALAIEDGLIAPEQLAIDVPISISGFSPKNYNKRNHGAIPYHQVITKSLNIPSVTLLQDYNVDRFLLDLKSLGFKHFNQSADYYGLPLILGGGEVSLFELVNAYSHLSEILTTYTSHSSRYKNDSSLELEYVINKKLESIEYTHDSQFISAAPIWHMLEAMLDVQRPDAEGNWERFSSSKRIHWKTGTSYGNRDAWAIGMTPEYTVGVWVGNSDGEGEPDIIGVSAAGVLLFDAYNTLDITESYEMPYDDMIELDICKKSGHIAGEHCQEIITKQQSQSIASTEKCPYHQHILLDPVSEKIVYRDCATSMDLVDTSWFVLPADVAYYYKSYHPDYSVLPGYVDSCSEYVGNLDNIVFTYPRENSALYIPVNIYGEKEKCILKAEHKDLNGKIYWHINDQYITMTEDVHELSVDLESGRHVVTIIDEKGSKKTRIISVVNSEVE